MIATSVHPSHSSFLINARSGEGLFGGVVMMLLEMAFHWKGKERVLWGEGWD